MIEIGILFYCAYLSGKHYVKAKQIMDELFK